MFKSKYWTSWLCFLATVLFFTSAVLGNRVLAALGAAVMIIVLAANIIDAWDGYQRGDE
jgi:hypothetical protein